MKTKTKQRTRVYSYIRFSSDEQSEGDSTRRQTEWRDTYLRNHPELELDDELKLLDEGRSAYKGEHRRDGALGKFLDYVQGDRVPTGSILLVESIDRLTRLEPFDALEMICFGLIKHGIAIQTQIARYDRNAMNNGQIHGLIAEIQRAYMESQHKSTRVRAARDAAFGAARDNQTILTARCPAWLQTVDANGKTERGDKPIPACDAVGFKPIPAAVTTIQRIYRMQLDGVSQHRIERALNDDPTAWQRPNGWRCSYIKKVLSNPAVIGIYQPHTRRGEGGKREPEGPPIPGYYPAIIEPEVYYAVQRRLAANVGKGGRTTFRRNIFTHLVKCGHCGGPMRYMDKGKREAWQYLACDTAARGAGCRYGSVRYHEVVDVVLAGCVYLDPAQVLPATDEHEARAAALRQRREGAMAELQDIEGQIENYTDQIGRTKVARRRDDYEARIAELEARAATLEAAATEAEAELAKLEHGPKSTREWQRGVADLMGAIREDDAVDMRAKLNAHLRDFIDRIEVFPHGFVTVADRAEHYHEERGELVPGRNGRRRKPARRWWDPNVDTIMETLDAAHADTPPPKPTKKQWAAFGEYVLARRMGKEGRFYRVHFKTGERVDLVPPGGLATGWARLGATGVEKVLPDIARLWREFEENGRL